MYASPRELRSGDDHMRLAILALAVALGGCASPPASPPIVAQTTTPSAFPDDAALLALIKARVDEGRAAGIVLGVMDADGSTRVVAYGDPGPGAQPLSANSVFEIGSISKVFTATALADMAQKGEVKLDDPVQLYAPAGLTMPTRNGKQITLGSLAEQNSGLPRLPGNLKPADMSNPYVDYHAEQLNAFLSGYTLTRDPGETYEYSNLGVGLLGYVLAAKAGVTYEELIAQRIVKPLGMTMTGQKLSPQMQAALAKGHNAAGAVVPLWDQDVTAGAGALRSSMTDMLKFLDANLGAPKTDLERAMRFAQTPSATARGPKIGLNWHTEVSPSGTEIVWHNGGTGGYGSYIGLDQKRGVGVVLLANTSGVPQDIAIHLIDPSSPLTPKPAPPVQRTEISLPIETLSKFNGAYAMDSTPTFQLTITVEDGVLIVSPTGQGKIPAFPEAELPNGGLKVFHKEVDAQITFTPAADGKPAYLTLHQNGQNMRFTKLP
ncbi:MAG: class A beta-lactamase-related serine hydrolase [Alphaproteobacteria bacterium]|nr:MAG: class A beta-lactamase-related serine hydrolase [Alphaproteobacteria bacterium]